MSKNSEDGPEQQGSDKKELRTWEGAIKMKIIKQRKHFKISRNLNSCI